MMEPQIDQHAYMGIGLKPLFCQLTETYISFLGSLPIVEYYYFKGGKIGMHKYLECTCLLDLSNS